MLQTSTLPADVDAVQRTGLAAYPKTERAQDAALWLLGELVVQPTTQVASRIFSVSKTLIVAAVIERVEADGGKRVLDQGFAPPKF